MARITPRRASIVFTPSKPFTRTPTIRSPERTSCCTAVLSSIRAPSARIFSVSFSTISAPPPSATFATLWPRGAGFAFSRNGHASSLPDQIRHSSVICMKCLPGNIVSLNGTPFATSQSKCATLSSQ